MFILDGCTLSLELDILNVHIFEAIKNKLDNESQSQLFTFISNSCHDALIVLHNMENKTQRSFPINYI